MSGPGQPSDASSSLISEKKPGGNTLGFGLEFREQTALVSLVDKRIAQGLSIDKLELEVPRVTFPFDLAGGAEQFRNRRCKLRTIALSLSEEDVQRILRTALQAERFGIDELQVSLDDGFGRLSGVFRVGSESSPFSARFCLLPADDLELRIGFFDLRLFGWLPVPVSSLVTQVARALVGQRMEQHQAAFLVVSPIKELLRWLLPSHGWKVPAMDGLRIDRARIQSGQISLISVLFPDELPAVDANHTQARSRVERDILIFTEGVEIFSAAEDALRAGRLEEARSLYLGRGEIEPGHPLAARRLLEIGLSNTKRVDELADLIRDRLARDPADVHALLCRAAMQQHQEDPEAGVSFEQAARACVAKGQRDDAIMAHMRAGQLLAQEDLDRAIANLEQLLILKQDHHQAMFLLADLYEDAGRWYRAIRLNLRLARQLDHPKEIAERHARMGRIYFERLDDMERARKHLDAALLNDSCNIQALFQQALVMQSRDMATRSARLLGRVIDLAEEGGQESILLDARLRLAKLWDEELDDPAIALAHYSQVLSVRPDHLDALYRVGRLAMDLDQPDKAAEAFSSLLDLEAAGEALPLDVTRSAGLALGRLFMDRPGGQAEARTHFARVVELDPSELDAWNTLEQIDRDSGSWAALVDVLEQKAALSRDPEQVQAALLESARVAGDKLKDTRRAEGFFRRLIKLEPGSEDALDGLTGLLQADERWSELEVLVMETISQDMAGSAAAERWAKVGELRVDHLSDLNGAMQAFEMACRLDPGNSLISDRLLGLYREHERHEAFAELLERLDPESFEQDVWTDLWIEHAGILADKLKRSDDAIESYQKALQADPNQLQALRALADLYYEDKRWQPAQECTLKVLDLVGDGGLSGQGRSDLHRRLAEIDLQLGNRSAAVEHLREVLSLSDADEEAAEQIASLLREDRRWEELAAFYAGRAEHVTGEEAASLHTASASIFWDKLEQIEPAASQYRAAVDAAPHSEGAPARLASLQRLYGQLSRWQDVSEVLRQRIDLGPGDDGPRLLMALASIFESRLEQEEQALDCFHEALRADPDFLPALVRLAEHYLDLGDNEQALDYGQRALGASLEPDSKEGELPVERRALLALGTARAAWALSDKEAAGKFYTEHMECFASRGYADVDPEALERLELLLRKARDYEELALLYRRWLKTEAVPDRRGGLIRSLALLLFEHLEQPDDAIVVLDDYVQLNAQDQDAVRELMEMLRRSARWERLTDLLSEHWERAAQPGERIERLEELAELYQLRLHNSTEAISRLRVLLDLGHLPAQERLLGIYRQEGMFSELIELLGEQAELEEDPLAASELWLEIGRLSRDELKESNTALSAFTRAFESIPSESNRDEVLDLLRESGEDRQLEEFLARCAAEAEDLDERRDLLLEHAEICLIRLDDRALAISSFTAALEIQAEESVARRVQMLYEEVEDYEGVADMQEILVDLAETESVAARRVFRLGQIYRKSLDAPERALAAYQTAVGMDPAWLEPNRALAELYQDGEQWEELLEVKEHMASVVNAESEQGALLAEAADLAFVQLRDMDRAVGLLLQAAQLVAEPAPVWLKLADWMEESGEPIDAADALENLVDPSRIAADMTDGVETPAVLFRRIARLRQEAGEDLAAIAAYERTLRQEPSDIESAENLESLYRAHERHEDLAQMLTDLANRRTGEQAAATWVAVARSWLEAQESDNAESALERALTAEPSQADASQLLAELLVDRSEWSRLLDLLEGLPDDTLEDDQLSKAVLACFAGVAAIPESEEQELASCRLMLRLDPIHIGALQRAARLLEKSGQADESEQFMRRLDEQADRLEQDYRYGLDLRLANIDFARGRINQAEIRLKRCIEARPDDPGPRAFLHKLYEGGQRFADRVVLLLEEAERVENAPERFEKRRAAAQLMELELGDPDGAARLYEQVVEEEPDRLEAWRKLTELHRLLEQPEQQRTALLRLAELSSGDERIRATRTAARLACGVLESPDARSDLERLLELVPEDAEALERLVVLDRSAGRFAELESHLAQLNRVTKDPVARTGMLREQASILIEQLDREPDAIVVLEDLIDELPSDSDALETIYRLYLKYAHWKRAAEVLEKRIGLVGTERQRAPMWAELAHLRQDHLDDAGAAVEAWRQAAALDPSRLEPWQQLRELAVAQEDKGLLVDALDALATRTEDEQEELKLRRSLGLLCWSLRRKDDARRAFSRVLIIDDDDLVARRFTARMLVEEDIQAAIPHLRWLVAHPDSLNESDLLAVRRQLAQALKDAEPDERIEALEGLLALEFSVAEAKQLAELYREVGKRSLLADLLARLGETEEQDEADPAPWLERADLMQQDGQMEDAAAALGRALSISGSHRYQVARRLAEIQLNLGNERQAVDSLELALQLRPDDMEVVSSLAGLYRDGQNWEQAETSLERWLEMSDDPDEAASVAVSLGEVRCELKRFDQAREAFERSIELDPGRLTAYAQLEDLSQEWPPSQQGAFFLNWAGSPAAGSRRPELFLLAAKKLQQADDRDSAIKALQEVLRLEPDNLETHGLLVGLRREQEDPDDLYRALEHWFKVEDDQVRRLELAEELARLALEHADDYDASIAYHEHCLALDDEHPVATLALADHAYRQGEWTEAQSLFESALILDSVPEERQAQVCLHAGRSALALDDPQGAVPHLEQAVRLGPVDPDLYHEFISALNAAGDRDGALLALEQALELGPVEPDLFQKLILNFNDAGDRDGALRVLEQAIKQGSVEPDLFPKLILTFNAAGERDGTLRVLELMVENLADGETCDRILEDLEQEITDGKVRARLLGLLGDRQGDSQGAELFVEHADLMHEQERAEDEAISLARAMNIEGQHQFAVCVRLGNLRLDVLKDEEGGLRALEKAWALEQDSADLLARLSDLYWSRSDWERAAEVTAQLLELSPREEQPGLALRLGDIHSNKEDPGLARQSYERALEMDPAYRQAYERLEQLLAQSAERSELARFYLGWANSPAAGSRRAALFLTAARQFERDGQTAASILALRAALQNDPDNPSMLELLAILLGQEQEWEELIQVLEQRRHLADDDQHKVALSFEIAQLCIERLNDPERSAEHLTLCLDLDGDHLGALDMLAGIRYDQGQWDEAGKLYSLLGDRGTLTARFLSAFRLGEIAEAEGDGEGALEHFRHSVEANPSFIPSRQSVLRLLSADRRYEELAEAARGLLSVVPDEGFDDLVLSLYRMLADAHRRTLQFEQAARASEQVLERDPDDLVAIRFLRDFHTNRKEWTKASEYVRTELILEPDLPDAAQRWDGLGDILQHSLDDPAGAEQAYGTALRLDGSRTSTAWKLWHLLCARNGWEEIRRLGEGLLKTKPEPDKAIELHRILGRAWMRDGQSDEKALAHFEKVLESGRADLEFIEEVVELARRARRWPLFVSLAGQALEIRLAQGLDPEVAMEGYLELARVYQEELADIARAAAAVRRALELHPRDPELLRRLGHLYSSNFDTYREAIEVFRELLGMDPTDPEFFRYLARLEAARGDTDRTACYYSGLRFLQPVDQEARRFLQHAGDDNVPSRAVNQEEWSRVLLHPGADCLLQRIFSALSPYLERLFPANLGRFQVVGQDVGPTENEHVHQIVERARALVAGRPLRVLVAHESVYQAWHESGPQPTLILSSAVLERSAPGELRFFVSREVMKIAMGCVLPLKFGSADLEQLLAILANLADVESQALTALPATATQYVEAIKRSVPGDVLEMIVPLIRQFALEPRAHDQTRWLAGVNRTADRAGLLACGDLNSALSVLTRFSPAAGGREMAFVPDRASLLTSDEDMLALFRFALSEQMLNLRATLGMSKKQV